MKFAIVLFNGLYLLVSADYFSQDDKYHNVSMGEADSLATMCDMDLPSPKLVDVIYEQATCKIKTRPRNPAKLESMAEQADDARYRRYGCIDTTLVAGHYKDIVQKNGRLGLYGWQSGPFGKRIQPFFPGHSRNYVDYSQAVRFVYRTAYKTKVEAKAAMGAVNKQNCISEL